MLFTHHAQAGSPFIHAGVEWNIDDFSLPEAILYGNAGFSEGMHGWITSESFTLDKNHYVTGGASAYFNSFDKPAEATLRLADGNWLRFPGEKPLIIGFVGKFKDFKPGIGPIFNSVRGAGSGKYWHNRYPLIPAALRDGLISKQQLDSLFVNSGRYGQWHARWSDQPGETMEFSGTSDGWFRWEAFFDFPAIAAKLPDGKELYTLSRFGLNSQWQGELWIDSLYAYPAKSLIDPSFDYSVNLDALSASFKDTTPDRVFAKIKDYHWDFGDGNTSSKQNPEHAYTQPGLYNVQLTLQTECAKKASVTNQVSVSPLQVSSKPLVIAPVRDDTVQVRFRADNITHKPLDLKADIQIMDINSNQTVCAKNNVPFSIESGLSGEVILEFSSTNLQTWSYQNPKLHLLDIAIAWDGHVIERIGPVKFGYNPFVLTNVTPRHFDVRPRPEQSARTKWLSDYHEPLRETDADTPIYVFAGPESGGTLFVLGGAHASEPAGIVASVLLAEQAKVTQGRLIVMPFGNPLAFDNMASRKLTYTANDEKRFIYYGHRLSHSRYYDKDPDRYESPSGEIFTGNQRKNLNRVWPGRPYGTPTERIAHAIIHMMKDWQGRQPVDIAFDLHECGDKSSLAWTLAADHPGLMPLIEGAVAAINREIGVELMKPRRSSRNGVSAVEWTKATGAKAFVVETGMSGRKSMEERVALHLACIRTTVDEYNYRAEKNKRIIIDFGPAYSQLKKNGIAAYLTRFSRSHVRAVSWSSSAVRFMDSSRDIPSD